MANPTTNYGFVLPTATDLVTDLPADFDVALQGVDTRLKALQPGTTLGDLAYSSATANTNTRLGIGTSGQVLAVNGSGVPAWTTTSAGSMTVIASGSFSTSASTLTISSIPATYKNLVFIAKGMRATTLDGEYRLRFNGDTSGVYGNYTTNGTNVSTSTEANPGYYIQAGITTGFLQIEVYDYANTSTLKLAESLALTQQSASAFGGSYIRNGYRSTSAINSLTIFEVSSLLFAAGTYILYGVN